MAEVTGEGLPHQAPKQEAKQTTQAHDQIDSAATPRQLPTESEQTRAERHARIYDLGQQIEQSVRDAEKLLVDAVKFPDLSQPAPSKNIEQKRPGIRGLISKGVEKVKGVIGKSKSTETPRRK